MSVYPQSQILQDQPVLLLAFGSALDRSLQQPRQRIRKLSCSGIPGAVLHLVLPQLQRGSMWMIPEVRGGKTEICR